MPRESVAQLRTGVSASGQTTRRFRSRRRQVADERTRSSVAHRTAAPAENAASGGGAVHRFAADLAHDVLLPARYGERFIDAMQEHFPVRVAVVVRAALETANEVACDEAVAV